ncbi:MAG TPA: DUF1559 domain-containing protein [Planctomycetia bacterium]|nr:DUF1559 domain-containing protein [Planctomycetia bacterium]
MTRFLAAFAVAAAVIAPALGADYDWKYVPKDAWLVQAAKPAETLKRKEFQGGALLGALKGLEEKGIPVTELEEWRMFVAGEGARGTYAGMVFQFAKPVDKSVVTKAMLPGDMTTTEQVGGKEIIRGRFRGSVAVIDEKTYLVIEGQPMNPGLENALAADGSGSPAVKRARELGSAPYVLAIEVAAFKELMKEAPPQAREQFPVPGFFEAMDKVNSLVAVATLDPKATIKATIETTSEENAKAVKDLIAGALALGKAALAAQKDQILNSVQPDQKELVTTWLDLGAKALAELEVTQDGVKVTAGLIEFISPEELGNKFGAFLAARAGEVGARRESNDLKQIGLALHNYHDAHGKFPSDITDKDGKAILSWRVEILPYLEEQSLYNEIKRDEPWDSEHNQKLAAKLPAALKGSSKSADKTRYLAIKGKGLAWEEGRATRMQQITDGTSMTIAVVKAAESSAVDWMKPDDLAFDAADPTAKLADEGGKFLALFFDGSVQKVSLKGKLAALFSISGGEPITQEDKD